MAIRLSASDDECQNREDLNKSKRCSCITFVGMEGFFRTDEEWKDFHLVFEKINETHDLPEIIDASHPSCESVITNNKIRPVKKELSFCGRIDDVGSLFPEDCPSRTPVKLCISPRNDDRQNFSRKMFDTSSATPKSTAVSTAPPVSMISPTSWSFDGVDGDLISIAGEECPTPISVHTPLKSSIAKRGNCRRDLRKKFDISSFKAPESGSAFSSSGTYPMLEVSHQISSCPPYSAPSLSTRMIPKYPTSGSSSSSSWPTNFMSGGHENASKKRDILKRGIQRNVWWRSIYDHVGTDVRRMLYDSPKEASGNMALIDKESCWTLHSRNSNVGSAAGAGADKEVIKRTGGSEKGKGGKMKPIWIVKKYVTKRIYDPSVIDDAPMCEVLLCLNKGSCGKELIGGGVNGYCSHIESCVHRGDYFAEPMRKKEKKKRHGGGEGGEGLGFRKALKVVEDAGRLFVIDRRNMSQFPHLNLNEEYVYVLLTGYAGKVMEDMLEAIFVQISRVQNNYSVKQRERGVSEPWSCVSVICCDPAKRETESMLHVQKIVENLEKTSQSEVLRALQEEREKRVTQSWE